MMRAFLFLVAASLSVIASAAPRMEFSVVGQNGEAISKDLVKLEIERTTAIDGEDVVCRAVSHSENPMLLRIEASVLLDKGMTRVFDGFDEQQLKGKVEKQFFLNDTFPLGAAWNGRVGRAIALGADNKDSYADFIATPESLKISLHAAFLKKGAVYKFAIHAYDFDAKYGVRDAFARYYPLYPKRFKRDPNVDPAIYGISAQYGAWRHSDSEACRIMNSSWDWCIGAARTWGDICGREQPHGNGRSEYTWDAENNFRDRTGVYRRYKNAEMTKDEFSSVLDERLGSGYYCGIANAYYVMALAKISPIIAKRFPDSVAVGKTFTEFGFNHATEVFVFPELSWYRQLTNDFAQLVKERDIGAIAFDVAFPRGVFRGEKLREMNNVSWDEYGAGIVRGAGAAALYDYLRTLKCKKTPYRLGVISNSNGLHISDKLYADTVMAESAPWEDQAPFPLRRRLIAGEKGVTLWEGNGQKTMAPDFNSWPKKSQNSLRDSLARCAVHRSFFAGASLPARGFLAEYSSVMSHAFVRMNDAGWKAVPGASTSGKDWQVARYGCDKNAYLAINNLSRENRQIDLDVFPGEMVGDRAGLSAEKGLLLVPFFGGVATNSFTKSLMNVDFGVEALGVGVLECVGEVLGSGKIAVRWAGVPGRATLKIESIDFAGEIKFKDACDSYKLVGSTMRKFSAGSTANVIFCDKWMQTIGETLRKKDFQVVELVRSSDSDAKDQADRVAYFFSKARSKKVTPVTIRVDDTLPPKTVNVGGIIITSDDRFVFSNRIKRFLDVLNKVVYPNYRPQTPLKKREGYKLYRL